MKGFSIIELLVSVSILLLLTLIGVWHWGGFTKEQALAKSKLGLISMFEEARSLAVSSKGNSGFGVHMSSTTATVFKGDTFVSGASDNIDYDFNSYVQAYSISLNNGGVDVSFSRLNGETTDYGNVVLFLTGDPQSSTTITILPSGVVK